MYMSIGVDRRRQSRDITFIKFERSDTYRLPPGHKYRSGHCIANLHLNAVHGIPKRMPRPSFKRL